MYTITRPLATLIVFAGLLAFTANASAATKTKSICAFPDVCIVYNGHAGLGRNG